MPTSRRKTTRVSDLQDGQAYADLCCSECFTAYSADKRDYWQLRPTDILRSGCCGAHMKLVAKLPYAG